VRLASDGWRFEVACVRCGAATIACMAYLGFSECATCIRQRTGAPVVTRSTVDMRLRMGQGGAAIPWGARRRRDPELEAAERLSVERRPVVVVPARDVLPADSVPATAVRYAGRPGCRLAYAAALDAGKVRESLCLFFPGGRAFWRRSGAGRSWSAAGGVMLAADGALSPVGHTKVGQILASLPNG
jgi:hypothetical protein